MKINIEEIEQMFGDDSDIGSDWKGDNAFQGLQIMSKYIDPAKENLIVGADHDVIYSADVSTLLERGMTKEDVLKLCKLNWTYDPESESFSCFV